jgi:hypothetical protein
MTTKRELMEYALMLGRRFHYHGKMSLPITSLNFNCGQAGPRNFFNITLLHQLMKNGSIRMHHK